MVYSFCKHSLQPTLQEARYTSGHLYNVWCELLTAAVGGAEVCVLKCVAELILVFFSYVKYEWPQARVFVGSVLFPGGRSTDGNYHTCARVPDFYC